MTEESGFEATVELGIAIAVSDMERALDFYCDHLGFDFVSEQEAGGEGQRIVTIRYGNAIVDLVTQAGGEKRQNFRLFWTVDNLELALEHLVAGGGRVQRQMEYGVYCADPDGNTILVKLKELEPDQAQELFF